MQKYKFKDFVSYILRSTLFDAIAICVLLYCLITISFPFFLTSITTTFELTASTGGFHKYAISYADKLSNTFTEDNTYFGKQYFNPGETILIKHEFNTNKITNIRITVDGGTDYHIKNLSVEGSNTFSLQNAKNDQIKFLSNNAEIDSSGVIFIAGSVLKSSGFELNNEINVISSHKYLYLFLGLMLFLAYLGSYFIVKDKINLWAISLRILPILLIFIYLLNLGFDKDLVRVYRTEYSVGFLNLIHSYGSFIIFLTIALCLIAFIKAKCVKWLVFGSVLIFILVNAVDLFLLYELNARLAFSEITNIKFSDFTVSFELIFDFLNSNQCFLIICLFYLVIRFFIINYNNTEGNKICLSNLIFPVLLVVCEILFNNVFPIPGSTIYDNDFSNVLYLNNSTEKVAYSDDYPFLSYKPAEYELTGINSRKNVILIILESFVPNNSIYFGGHSNNMPNLDKLAAANLSFTNYFSNGYNSDTGNFAIYTGRPYIQSDRSIIEDSLYNNAVPKVFAKNGYKTQIMYSSRNVFNFDKIIKAAGFSEFFDGHDDFYSKSERLTFDSVPDHDLFANLLRVVKSNKATKTPYFTTVITSTTHAPFIMPGTHIASFVETLKYTDNEVQKLYMSLSNMDYFKDGILVLVSDHRVMNPLTVDEVNDYGLKSLGRVPLVIIDKSFSAKEFKSRVAHDSLGTILQFLTLPKVKMYDYQRNPIAAELMNVQHSESIASSNVFYKNLAIPMPNIELIAKGDAKDVDNFLNKDESVYYQKLGPRDEVLVFSEQNYLFKLNGDATAISGTSSTNEQDMLKLLTWFRMH
jgi:hypothetical protein